MYVHVWVLSSEEEPSSFSLDGVEVDGTHAAMMAAALEAAALKLWDLDAKEAGIGRAAGSCCGDEAFLFDVVGDDLGADRAEDGKGWRSHSPSKM